MNQLPEEKRQTLLSKVIGFFERGLFAPFLLAVQPVLHLFSINATEMYFSEAIRSMFVSLFLGMVVLGLAYLLLRNWLRAGAVASLFIFLFFLFGDISDWAFNTLGLGPARTDLLVVVSMVICMTVWIWLVQKRIENIASLNLYFNVLGILFLLFYGTPTVRSILQNGISLRQETPLPVAAVESNLPRPDIYYIILDSYGRQDTLQELYEFDNSDFLNALKVRGFYVAEESTSNYVQTLLSMSSALNMEYLQSLEAQGTTLESRDDVVALIQKSRVRNVLAQNGYQLVSFRNSYNATVPSAEIYYDDTGFAYPVTPFESMLIDHTLARVLLYVPAFNKVLIEMPYEVHRNQILSTFAELKDIPALEGDYFVYAHILAPHPPFVFDETGDPVTLSDPFQLTDGNNYIKMTGHTRKGYILGYRRQIQYVNTLVLDAVDAILAQSKVPPIIIVQGDHGPGSHLHQALLEKTSTAERFRILNAYYFPTQDYTQLYPSISPVNSFRVILNQFFESNYELLPDRHFYSNWRLPFDFTEVTNFSLPR